MLIEEAEGWKYEKLQVKCAVTFSQSRPPFHSSNQSPSDRSLCAGL